MGSLKHKFPQLLHVYVGCWTILLQQESVRERNTNHTHPITTRLESYLSLSLTHGGPPQSGTIQLGSLAKQQQQQQWQQQWQQQQQQQVQKTK